MFSGEAKKSVSISLNFDDIKSLMDEYFNANDPDSKKEIHSFLVFKFIIIALSKISTIEILAGFIFLSLNI